MKVMYKKVRTTTTYKAKKPPIVIRLITVFLLFVSVLSGLLKRWDVFGISLVGILLIIVILVCYILLSTSIDDRFDQLEKLIKSKDEKPKDEQKQ